MLNEPTQQNPNTSTFLQRATKESLPPIPREPTIHPLAENPASLSEPTVQPPTHKINGTLTLALQVFHPVSGFDFTSGSNSSSGSGSSSSANQLPSSSSSSSSRYLTPKSFQHVASSSSGTGSLHSHLNQVSSSVGSEGDGAGAPAPVVETTQTRVLGWGVVKRFALRVGTILAMKKGGAMITNQGDGVGNPKDDDSVSINSAITVRRPDGKSSSS
ncbi:hypothetical protein K470DRAFT_264304 [Piedraia hortae CBS 480.64]|uniref:Uncharacterized protein n=1 Tax=Piedraia hortae CBS 480.64 TaxID=1314780 RepID=A0A6A7C065_9PEZI|nr:hypothetical protein K470DRAFT_264304 [Piedraia hortae CBS 480.64]